MQWSPIRYRDFWDQPRIFLVAHQGQHFLFDCAFDDEIEDYPESYKVYRVPAFAETELAGSWAELHRHALRYLAEVPLADVHFDESRRKAIDPSILDQVITRQAVS